MNEPIMDITWVDCQIVFRLFGFQGHNDSHESSGCIEISGFDFDDILEVVVVDLFVVDGDVT